MNFFLQLKFNVSVLSLAIFVIFTIVEHSQILLLIARIVSVLLSQNPLETNIRRVAQWRVERFHVRRVFKGP